VDQEQTADSVFKRDQPVVTAWWERGLGGERDQNVSSVNGHLFRARGAFGQTNYAADEGGMHGFTKALGLRSRAQGA